MIQRDMMRARSLAIAGLLAIGAALGGGACDETVPSDQTASSASSSTTSSTSSGGGAGGAGTGGMGMGGGGGAAPDCYMTPMTHVEIINACTDADKIDKKPDLPLLGMDGKLPPLP